MYFVDLEKALDRVPRAVIEWEMRQVMLPEALMRALMRQA